MRVLVTGASGFVGGAVARQLARDARMQVRAAVRRPVVLSSTVEPVTVSSLDRDTDWTSAVRRTDTVVHAAARVHVMKEAASDALAEFRAVNVHGTVALARQSVRAGVRRFVFVSSIKVNGEETPAGCPFTPEDAPAPVDPYGISKLEAERELRAIADATGMELVVVRPVLVYGPGVRANFRSMMHALLRGIPLPFGAIDNRRSLVALPNLADLIIRCVERPAAANEVFLVSDGEDLSTSELLRRTATALGVSARLFPVPSLVVEAALRLLGRGQMAQRLCRSLQVDTTRTRELLDWSPPVRVDDALAETAAHFMSGEGA